MSEHQVLIPTPSGLVCDFPRIRNMVRFAEIQLPWNLLVLSHLISHLDWFQIVSNIKFSHGKLHKCIL